MRLTTNAPKTAMKRAGVEASSAALGEVPDVVEAGSKLRLLMLW